MKSAAFSTGAQRTALTTGFSHRWWPLLAVVVTIVLLPSAKAVPGSLTCGQIAFGRIGKRGESNFWSFAATAGNTVIVRTGALVLTGTNSLDAVVQLFSPTGTLVAQGGGDSSKAVDVSTRATDTGSFKVIVIAAGNPGDYRIDFTSTGCPATVSAGGGGGVLTNGFLQRGTVDVGTLDTWTFNANAGDGILVRMGNSFTNSTMDPYLRLYGPDGAPLNSVGGYGYKAEEVSARAPTAGTYTVVVNGGSARFGREDGSGSYRITLVQTGAAVVTALGDEGGAMTNGFMHTGSIVLGDADVWIFPAKAGDGIFVRIGNLSTNGVLDPYLRVYGPDGVLATKVVGGYGYKAGEVSLRAATKGTFTVVLTGGNFPKGGEGSYRLTLAKTGDPVVTAPGDEGGAMTNGFMHTGFIALGDADVWTFNAKAGDAILARMGNATTNDVLDPYLRIYGPGGELAVPVVGQYGYKAEHVALRAPTNGVYTVILTGGSFATGGEGRYRLTLAKTGEPIVTAPGDQGGALTNGYMHTGFIDLGDLDVWSVDVKAGDSIVVRMGDLSSTNALDPYLWLFGPDGKTIQYVGGYGYIFGEVATRATSDGAYMVVLAGGNGAVGGTGEYRLSLAKNSDPIVVAAGDQGGALEKGEPRSGDIPTGDLDVWSFPVTTNTAARVALRTSSSDIAFQPWLRLYAPDGRLAFSQFGGTNIEGTLIAANKGLATAVVADAGKGYATTTRYEIGLLSSDLTITGHVYCICNSNALAGASVRLGTSSTTSDAAGAYGFSHLSPGTYTAIASAVDQLNRTNQVTLDGFRSVTTNDFYLTNLTFVLHPILHSSITSLPADQLNSISNTLQEAAQVYSHYLTDPICVQVLYAATNDMFMAPSGSHAATETLPYAAYYDALQRNPHQSVNDNTALATLPVPPNIPFLGNTDVQLTAAALDAIGDHERAKSARQSFFNLNGLVIIKFYQMNLTRSETPNPLRYDLLTTVYHETDEVLGIGGYGSTLEVDPGDLPLKVPSTAVIGPLDLYRYQQVKLGPARTFSLSDTISAYFSIDGGKTPLVFFNQAFVAGVDYGDWGDGLVPPDGQSNDPPQVQDAKGSVAEQTNLGRNELIALDVIGYTLRGAPTIHSITPDNGQPLIQFFTVPGQTYQVYRSSNLIIWEKIGNPFVAQNIETAFTDHNPAGLFQFYIVIPIDPVPAGP